MTKQLKEYIITEEQLKRLEKNGVSYVSNNIAEQIRSRPAPAAPTEGKYAEMATRPEFTPEATLFDACQKCKATIRNQTLAEQRKNIVFEIVIDKLKRDEYVREVVYQISKYVGTNTKITFESLRNSTTAKEERR